MIHIISWYSIDKKFQNLDAGGLNFAGNRLPYQQDSDMNPLNRLNFTKDTSLSDKPDVGQVSGRSVHMEGAVAARMLIRQKEEILVNEIDAFLFEIDWNVSFERFRVSAILVEP